MQHRERHSPIRVDRARLDPQAAQAVQDEAARDGQGEACGCGQRGSQDRQAGRDQKEVRATPSADPEPRARLVRSIWKTRPTQLRRTFRRDMIKASKRRKERAMQSSDAQRGGEEPLAAADDAE